MENKQEELEVLGHNKGYTLISITQTLQNKLQHFNIIGECNLCGKDRQEKREEYYLAYYECMARKWGGTELLEIK